MRDELYSLLADPGPDSWRQICAILSRGSEAEIVADIRELKRELRHWPPEVERPAPLAWVRERAKAKLSLCRKVREVDLYKLYCDVADDPRLRLGDGTPAVRLQRNFRGSLQGAHGRVFSIGVDGQGDLAGSLCIERPRGRVAVALEVEIKRLAGEQNPKQVERQAALERRGEIYLLVRRTEEMIRALITHRERLVHDL